MTSSYIITKFFGNNNKYFNNCLNIRKHVFVIEQQIPESIEADKFDKVSHHVLLSIFSSTSPIEDIGTARWRETNNGIKLERFAILPPYRNKGYGKIILHNILKDVIKFDKTIYLHAQESAVNFYLKHNFVVIEEPFYEAGIKHYKMIYYKSNQKRYKK